MGFKGKAVKLATRAGRFATSRRGLAAAGAGAAGVAGLSLAAGGPGGPGGMGGMTGTYRVNSNGTITKVTLPRKRRRGYRMPRMVAETMRAQQRLVDAVATAVAVGAVRQ